MNVCKCTLNDFLKRNLVIMLTNHFISKIQDQYQLNCGIINWGPKQIANFHNIFVMFSGGAWPKT